MRLILIFLTTLFMTCTAFSAVDNESITSAMPATAYSFENSVMKLNNGEYTIVIAMSGGGTRASALSYGVLKALRAEIHPLDSEKSLLNEVDAISSVSGGSFTAAYYGLYGDKIFSDFEQDFLYHDVSSDLIDNLFNPFQWFSEQGRTEEAINLYNARLFKDATFADIREDSPLIIINASDLGNGVRFSFLQEYFDLLCSDLSQYPIANAVTASSAVPVVFNPVVLENYDTCKVDDSYLMRDFKELSPMTRETLIGLSKYQRKDYIKYIHLVDGGITDNLGLLALYDIADLGGGQMEFFEQTKVQPRPHYVIISIDASAKPESMIHSSPQEPGISETISAMTDIQLHRFNTTTRGLIEKWSDDYGKMTSSKMGINVETYLININLSDFAIPDKEKQRYLNNIPTDLTLEKEQVDALVMEGYVQLQNHPEFFRLMGNIKKQAELQTSAKQ
ncbi:patatin-like phospholipase family protein [Vibrio maerlii]|uniref:patatin-like phospholipase family protein n=1 Tax=Vibrio maerlii TaxID=2231648 RepID=UPI000E3DA0CF|nr:patatin-like phospholipase family protein [Vibrio maerlii]